MSYRIKELRKLHGWTQDHLADLIGCSKGHVSEMEAGKKNPSAPLLETIARVFDVTVPELYVQSSSPDIAAFIARFDRLSDEGKKKLAEYAEFLELQQRQVGGQE